MVSNRSISGKQKAKVLLHISKNTSLETENSPGTWIIVSKISRATGVNGVSVKEICESFSNSGFIKIDDAKPHFPTSTGFAYQILELGQIEAHKIQKYLDEKKEFRKKNPLADQYD